MSLHLSWTKSNWIMRRRPQRETLSIVANGLVFFGVSEGFYQSLWYIIFDIGDARVLIMLTG